MDLVCSNMFFTDLHAICLIIGGIQSGKSLCHVGESNKTLIVGGICSVRYKAIL